MSASAILYKSASDPEPFALLHPNKMNRQLSGVYPLFASIRSRLQLKGYGPRAFFGLRSNCMPVSSQRPVHCNAHHSSVSVNSMFLFAASSLLAWKT